jgi:hypothetical protein
MSEKFLCNGAKMTAAVANARDWASKLVQRESRGPGDTENAMRRLESRYGISWRTFWALRYRPPTDVFVSVYERLGAAYQVECERQERLMRHECEITKAKTGPFHPAVIAAEALAGEEVK